MALTGKEAGDIRVFNERLPKALTIGLVKTADARTLQFDAFAETLAQLAPKITCVPREEGHRNLPALLLEDIWRYHMVPAGAELKPFLELLTQVAGNSCDVPEGIERSVKEIRHTCRIKIYVTGDCPYCKEVMMRIAPLPILNALLHITVIDGALFPELAARDNVRSAPTVICDEQFRWTGQLRLEELLHVAGRRDPGRMDMEVFKRMLLEGETSRLAAMMLASNRIFPAFLETLTHAEWSTRLGAMVVFEDIIERRPELARKALEPIWKILPALDDTVKGDMVYLLGKTGDAQWITRLERFLSSEYSEEFREVAEEAIENLKQKY